MTTRDRMTSRAFQLAGPDRRGPDPSELPALHEALADIGYAGPLILECAGDLAGPSLATRTVDERRLRSDLLDSMAMLGDVRARAEGRVAPGPGL